MDDAIAEAKSAAWKAASERYRAAMYDVWEEWRAEEARRFTNPRTVVDQLIALMRSSARDNRREEQR